jgi:hypothetical protein
MRQPVTALIVAARREKAMREALEAWRAAYDGQDIGDIALRDGRATAARVRMTREALGIES